MKYVPWVIVVAEAVALGFLFYKYYKQCKVIISMDKTLEHYAKKVVGADAVKLVKQKYGIPEWYPENK